MDFLIYAAIGAALLVVVGFVIGFVIGFRRSVAERRASNPGETSDPPSASTAESRTAAAPSHNQGTAANHRQEQSPRGKEE
ncbi:hypothetical protein CKO15_07740 [Halorhodospira abdelmalekii]|nr:hypothetical protein [Halorhodospira abdelmalekii]